MLIANDITHKAGSFGTWKDVVFKMASEFAREIKSPRLYITANSCAWIAREQIEAVTRLKLVTLEVYRFII